MVLPLLRLLSVKQSYHYDGYDMSDKNEKTTPAIDDMKYMGTMEMVMLRNFYYYNAYRKLMIVFLMLMFIIFALSFFLRYEINNVPPPRYIATTIEGVPLKLVNLDQRNLQNNELLTWAMEAAIEAYNMNYVNYRYAIQKARNYFTPDGYELYLKALNESRNLEAVKRKKMIVFAKINGQPQILEDTDTNPDLNVDGKFAWQVQIPVLVTYENGNPLDRIIQSNILTILITRVSPLEAPLSIGINSFVSQNV